MVPVEVTGQEAVALRSAVLSVLTEGGDGASGAERALAALRGDLAPEPPVSDPVRRWALREMSSDEAHVEVLAGAVAERRRVSFRYRSGETPADQTRRVEPWGLGYRNGAWYLASYDVDRRDSRVFRLGRIVGEVRKQRRSGVFTVPPDLVLARFFAAPPWSFGPIEGPSVEARLLVSPPLTATLKAVLPERAPWRDIDGGRALLRLHVRDAGAFFDWLLPLHQSIEIVGPDDMRAQLAVRLETTAILWGR